MYLTSAEGYKIAAIDLSIIVKTGEIWTKIKDVEDGLGVQNISEVLQKRKLKNTKWLKKKFLESLII